MKNHLKMLLSAVLMALLLTSCENNLEILLPQGPQGEKGDKGDKGDPGKSAFELWLEVYEKDPGTSIEEFFESLKGQNGQNGQNGEDGKSAYQLWKEAVDRGEMTNKDGSEYTDGNTWEDFLRWLQGGDVFILYEIWRTIPGNGDKTIEEFINELFDCMCSGSPNLPPVELGDWTLTILDDNYLSFSISGMTGMTVRAIDATNSNNYLVLTEDPEGIYSTDHLPRYSDAYTFILRAEKEDYKTADIYINVDGEYLSGQ